MGGYKANDASVPEDGCNEITLMCLKASRRLPLTAPCLSLRMHKNMPTEVIEPSHLHTAYFLILCSIAQSKDVYILFSRTQMGGLTYHLHSVSKSKTTVESVLKFSNRVHEL